LRSIERVVVRPYGTEADVLKTEEAILKEAN